MQVKKPRDFQLGLPAAVAVLLLGFGLNRAALSGEPEAGDATQPIAQDAEFFDAHIRPILAGHCLACHAGEKPKGDLRLDLLTPDFGDTSAREQWLAVLKRVQAGEMPPKSKPRPTESEIQALSEWISGIALKADAGQIAQGRVVMRRLNRVEYQNTLCDLLGVDVDLKELLPQDTSANGFDNIGEALHTSSFLMERYLDAAETALNAAIANLPQPPSVKTRYSLKETHDFKSTTERVYRAQDDTVVLFSSSPWNAVHLTPFYPPDPGRYRFRIAVRGIQSSGKPVTYRVDAGLMLMTGKTHLVGYFDAPAENTTVLDFFDRLEARNTIRILPYGLASAQTVDKIGADSYDGPGLAVDWVEVEGPLYDTWPPESHRRIFGDLAPSPSPSYNHSDRVEVVSNDPLADAERILRDFARRAFRRAVRDDDVEPFLELVKTRLAAQDSFEQALRVGLLGVLVSPEFLFLREESPSGVAPDNPAPDDVASDDVASDDAPPSAPGRLDDFALASRLSYFLWSTMPDLELLSLAEQRKLGQPETLRLQVERMIESPKATALTENFVGQWLGLRDIDFTLPSHILYPEFDDMLKVSMLRETELFFAEVLKNDLSITNFVASDFTMLNGRLAKHYGISGVDGWEFRKVPLPPASHRGGVLTMASVLKVTANGTSTSPVTRGAWVLNRILGTPPPRPPENVAALEPDTRGATTIREQLAKHRQIESCASCHAQIDPPGYALESFDVIGGWREHYRTSGNGTPVIVEGRTMPYLDGPKVDPTGELPDGRQFKDIDELKQLLLTEKDQLARALTEKLLTYATGAAPSAADRPAIDAIVGKIRENDYGLRTLVHEIVQSDLFRTK